MTGIIGRTRAGRAAPTGADPARRGQDGEPSEPRQRSAVLTDLLTTDLDHDGRRGTEKPREQGRCDRLDSGGAQRPFPIMEGAFLLTGLLTGRVDRIGENVRGGGLG